jgi:two-component system, chemotaxis family, CheB/CheR fusion protein
VLPRPQTADLLPLRPAGAAVNRATADDGGAAPRRRFSYGELHTRMLEQYAPPSVIVNEHLDVIHLSASAGQFLQPGGGVPSPNVLTLASEGLRRALRTLLHHAFRDLTPVSRQVRMRVDGATVPVRVQVRPVVDERAAGTFALIVFEVEGETGSEPDPADEGAGPGTRPAEVALEQELTAIRNQLESTMAAHDETVAELQTVNEELQSINEEQRAAAQELETGREEIQAINEELTTINQEHQSTIEELKRTNADLQNLIESTEIGTIFLDRAMRIRRFTPAATTIFNFLPADHGVRFPTSRTR